MFIHRSRLVASLLFLAVLSTYGCDDNGGTYTRFSGTGPSSIGSIGFSELTNSTDFFSRGVTLRPGTIAAQRVRGGLCPAAPPFVAPVTIVAIGNGAADFFLTHVDLEFVDRTGLFGGSLAVPRSQLMDWFGSTHIPHRGTRSFVIPFRFGCVGQPTGTLRVVVFGGDGFGRELRTSQSVVVR